MGWLMDRGGGGCTKRKWEEQGYLSLRQQSQGVRFLKTVRTEKTKRKYTKVRSVLRIVDMEIYRRVWTDREQ